MRMSSVTIALTTVTRKRHSFERHPLIDDRKRSHVCVAA